MIATVAPASVAALNLASGHGSRPTVGPGRVYLDYLSDFPPIIKAAYHITAICVLTLLGCALLKSLVLYFRKGRGLDSNASGTVAEVLDYYPFGGVRLNQQATSFGEQYRFTGHEFDIGTGLNYMDARYEAPMLRRQYQIIIRSTSSSMIMSAAAGGAAVVTWPAA
jgi:hypothetical protein